MPVLGTMFRVNGAEENSYAGFKVSPHRGLLSFPFLLFFFVLWQECRQKVSWGASISMNSTANISWALDSQIFYAGTNHKNCLQYL